ncbi:MAG: HD domain-containing protein [Clostridia bacterium]|nr:HD domain-containing protein [Clostridia bacterium]
MVIKIPTQVNRALEILCGGGHSAFIVGGAVRNILMGIPVHDWDIASSALPNETLELFKDYRTVETGLKHGTVTVIIDGMSLEITTFRIENGYSDNRHPDSVDFTRRIDEDLSRRDFTVNAIAYSSQAGFVDPFDGIEDINRGVIRCVGEVDRRFGEDALRILRALRFAAVLGFEIDPETAKSIKKNYRLLANISVERIFTELSKLLCGKNAGKILREYKEVIFYILPELSPTDGCTQSHERHVFDVWGHTVAAVEHIPPEPALRFAMLFHDAGKPKCKTTDENGVDHFYSHGKESKKIAFDAMTRLKTSNKFREHVCNLVEYHDFLPDKISKKTYKKYIARLGIDTVKELFLVREADVSAQNPKFLKESLAENEIGKKKLEEIENENTCFKISDLAVNGKDLAEAGITPSPAMGEILTALLDEVMEDKLENNKELLIERAKQLAKL